MRNVRDYAIVTGTYWAFTLTDGALRMLVLLHLHERGFAPLQLALLFVGYELFGVITNFLGGWVGARFGLKSTLVWGLGLQVVALGLLCVDPTRLSVAWVMSAQGLSGIAKDLTKMSSKSYVKLVVPQGDPSTLLRWVALLTGSKNTLKGVGFFLGGVLLTTFGFRGACAGMAVLILAALIVSLTTLPAASGRARGRVTLRHLFSRDPRLNRLAAARLFLFGSRDVWFVVALPIFLAVELGWSHRGVGAFLALWVIGYGIVQASAPAYVGGRAAGGKRRPPGARRLGGWTASLLVPLVALALALELGAPPAATLMVGLAIFGVLFAANSAIHSYLVVHYAEEDKVALDVGFYYMANAMGRLIGTLLSGLVFQATGGGRAGLVACLWVSLGFVTVSALACLPLARAERAASSSRVAGEA